MVTKSKARRTGPVLTAHIPYSPRPLWQRFHESKARWRVVVAHRRSGKTVAGINELIRDAFRCRYPRPRLAYIAPYQVQAKGVAWDYLKLYAGAVPGTTFNESELRCDFPNGARIRLFGADNHNALRGHYFDGVVCDEFGDWDPAAFSETIRPALSDRGGWAAFPGTPRGRNAFYDLYERARRGDKDWELWELKASDSKILPEAELADARTTLTEAGYEREFECSFDASDPGAYYGKEMTAAQKEGRICRIPIEPLCPTDTVWDLGIDDATVVWFVQDVGKERRLIDYLEISGAGLPEIVKCLEKKNYRYRRHILPHDAQTREFGTGVSRYETLQEFGVLNIDIAPRLGVSDGINAVRLMLPRCWFDVERCARGIDALRQYRREWDGKTQTWREHPLHDWTSHAADALRYLALTQEPIKQPRHIILPDYGIV